MNDRGVSYSRIYAYCHGKMSIQSKAQVQVQSVRSNFFFIYEKNMQTTIQCEIEKDIALN